MDCHVHKVFQERNIEGLSGWVFARATCFATRQTAGSSQFSEKVEQLYKRSTRYKIALTTF